MIRRIDFNCRSLERREPARVDIAADIGQYRADWRRSPDWDRMWSRMFNWGDDRHGVRPVGGRVGDDRIGDYRVGEYGVGDDRYVTLGTGSVQRPRRP